ncbi:MAG: S1 RNA-binding domain-containing protein [Acidimicrobiales bacterium]
MPIEHIVVDGSNIATEGRSLPSLSQLEEAVAELRRDHPNAEITVIVDATFEHRIDPSELPRFEQAALRGEYVHPPAGAIGRGDAFLLRVAEKVDGTVLSNDSFQEFHGEHPWLFERGRLLGGTPVPGIGWIFSPRQPVRGPRSHHAVRETMQAKKRVTKAIAVATKEVVEPVGQSTGAGSSDPGSKRRTGSGATGPERPVEGTREGAKPTPLAVNDPLPFISFIAAHRLGEQLEGEVEGYTSHGAVVRVGEMRCYVPLANLGDPAPRSAREVLKRHQTGNFVLTALDPQRRGAELALPGIALVSGHPRAETVAAEVRLARPPWKRADGSGSKTVGRAKKASAAQMPAKAVPEKAAARKVAAKKTAAEKVAVGKAVPEKAAARKVVAKKAAAEKAAARKATAKRVPPAHQAAPPRTPEKAPRARKASVAPGAARATERSPADAAQTASVPGPADYEPRVTPTARRSPRTTASVSGRGTLRGDRGRRGTG